MKKKNVSLGIFVTALTCAAVSRVAAQNQCVDFFLVDHLDKAKICFEQQLNSGSNAAEASYYLGEIAYAQDDKDQAKAYYEKGLAADNTYSLNKVGLAKFLIKTDAKAGEKELSAIASAEKKNVTVLLAIAKVYYDNQNQKKGEEMVSKALKADKQSPLVPMFEGDLKKSKDAGEAAAKYEQAILKKSDYPIPYIKIAQIYVNITPRAALERIKDVLEMQPDYSLAKQYQARAYYNAGAYEQAIEIYEKIFDAENSPLNDLTDYAASLFFTQRYDDALALINKGVAKDANNFVLTRLQMYGAVEQANYELGLESARKFFALPLGDNKYIPRDYLSYGDILSGSQQINDAIAQYNLAVQMSSDKEKPELYRQVSEKLNKKGYFVVAADFYQKYVDAQLVLDGEIGAMEYFMLGQSFYKAATTVAADSLRREELPVFLDKADSAFATVTKLAPDNIASFMFRARVSALRDPNTELGLAKPLYETALGIILEKENAAKQYRRELLEIYRYLSYYYYVQYNATIESKAKDKATLDKAQADKDQVLMYSNKMLELDANNAIARQLIDALTEQPAAAKKAKK